jgi:hypothetical protein
VLASGEHLEANSPAGQLARDLISTPNAHIYTLNSLRHAPLKQLARRTLTDAELRADTLFLQHAQLHRYNAPLHATAPDLVAAATRCAPLQRLLLVHGRPQSLHKLKRAIKSASSLHPIVPEHARTLSL